MPPLRTRWQWLLAGAVLTSFPPAHFPDAEPRPAAGPYAVAHDAPLRAAETVIDTTDTHRQFRVEFNGIKGDRVPGFLYVPRKNPVKCPAVLLQYGSGGNKKTDYIVQIGRQFVGQGFVVLTIDAPERGD